MQVVGCVMQALRLIFSFSISAEVIPGLPERFIHCKNSAFGKLLPTTDKASSDSPVF